MRIFKFIAAALISLSLCTSCGLLGSQSTGTTAGTTQTASTGLNTGSALSTILGVLLNSGSIDLGNLTNLINLGQILLGANSLVDATPEYTTQFASDLIKGSNKKVNKGNVDAVMQGLRNLAGSDTSALTKATTAAFAGNLVPVTLSDKGVKDNMAELDSILKLMK